MDGFCFSTTLSASFGFRSCGFTTVKTTFGFVLHGWCTTLIASSLRFRRALNATYAPSEGEELV
jgi:hypothetical protein